MPKGSRRAHRAREAHPPLDVERVRLGGTHIESAPDGEWQVRFVASPDKTYRCPGCAQEIPPRLRHIVAWRADGLFGPEQSLADRRHWHTGCWRSR